MVIGLVLLALAWLVFPQTAWYGLPSLRTLRAAGLTPPDRLEMVDWGTLADNAWSFVFPSGADFTRSGEEAQDTAVALYWDPRPLGPGESYTHEATVVLPSTRFGRLGETRGSLAV